MTVSEWEAQQSVSHRGVTGKPVAMRSGFEGQERTWAGYAWSDGLKTFAHDEQNQAFELEPDAVRPLPAICEAIERKAGYPRANPEPVPYCWAHKVAHTLRADGQYRCPHCGATYHAYMIDSTGKVTPVRQ